MKYTPEYIPGTKVEVVVKDEQVEELITNILNRLGNTSGKIFVTDVPTVVDIRTSKRGESAL
jgi:nitrogen regulatory protein P-II 1